MDETTHPRTLDEVQHGVETVLRDFIVKESKNVDVPSEGIADDRIDKIGKMSALAIVEASETTARDIKAAAQTAVDVAADIMKEAEQLAGDLQGNGRKIGEHLREFAALAKKVRTAMRETRSSVLGSQEQPMPPASLLPRHKGAPSIVDGSSA